MNDPDVKLLIAIALIVGIATTAWLLRDDLMPPLDEPIVSPVETVTEEATEQAGPLHPIAEPNDVVVSRDELVPLPPLDDSDAYFLLALVDVFGAEIEAVLVNEALIDKFVATLDNLPRGHVAEQIRPVGRLEEPFVANPAAEQDSYLLGDDNFVRYDALVELVESADIEVMVATYRRFYPLLQKSYIQLGYPNAYLNDRVVEVIDLLLATPEPPEPIRLLRPHVLYEFADPELESLSSGQKLLVRMGGERAMRIKLVLQDFRAKITRGAEEQE